MPSEIHIAGLPVRVGNHKRQLCAWCGLRLVDVDLRNCCSMDGGEPAHWELNQLVRVEEANPTVLSAVKHTDGDRIPAGWCGDEGQPRLAVVPDAKEGDGA